jgi:hypothetical protein
MVAVGGALLAAIALVAGMVAAVAAEALSG